MAYVSSIERFAKTEGIAIGEKRGIIIGEKKGRIEGQKKGRMEGRIEGRIEGRKKARQEIAGKLLADDYPIEKIVQYTGLSEEEITKRIK